MNAFDLLPKEIILGHIIPKLDLPEICTLRQVSCTWNELIEDYFSQLRRLDVTDVKHILTEYGFFSIVLQLKRLHEICLDGCWVMASQANLFCLFRNCPGLKCLSMKRCKFVNDDILEELSMRCSGLEILNISCCYQVTDSGIAHIVRRCRKLRKFSCNKNYGFTDKGVMLMRKNGENLEELDMGHCVFVTDEGLHQLLEDSMKLSYLRITGCNKVSEVMVKKFVEKGIVINNCY